MLDAAHDWQAAKAFPGIPWYLQILHVEQEVWQCCPRRASQLQDSGRQHDGA